MNMSFDVSDLYAYGAWARSDFDNLGAVSAWYYIERGNVARSSRSGCKYLSDERADKLDKAVCVLCSQHRPFGEVFIDHYIKGLSQRQISDIRGYSRSQVKDYLNFASGFVLGTALLLADKG